MPCGQQSRDWSDAAVSQRRQGLPQATHREKEARQGSPLQVSETVALRHLDFCHFKPLPPPHFGALLQQPRETNTSEIQGLGPSQVRIPTNRRYQ